MKVAIPQWQDRVSPVFDVASNLLVADVAAGVAHNRHTVRLNSENVQRRVNSLVELGVDVLICGAISWPLELALSNAGVEVVPQTCGEVERVLDAFAAGQWGKDAFLMPGCCGRRRRFRKQSRENEPT